MRSVAEEIVHENFDCFQVKIGAIEILQLNNFWSNFTTENCSFAKFGIHVIDRSSTVIKFFLRNTKSVKLMKVTNLINFALDITKDNHSYLYITKGCEAPHRDATIYENLYIEVVAKR